MKESIAGNHRSVSAICVHVSSDVLIFVINFCFSVLLSKTKVKSKRRDKPERSERPKTG